MSARRLGPASPRRRRAAGFAGLALAGLVVAGVAGRGWLRPLSAAPGVTIAEVRPGRFVREVTATGVFKAVKATPISVPQDVEQMLKVAWLAEEGTVLREGEPVVLFDSSDLTRDLTDGKADRESSLRKIEKTHAANGRMSGELTIDRDMAREDLRLADTMASQDPQVFSRNEVIEAGIDRDLARKRYQTADGKLGTRAKLGEADLALNRIEEGKAGLRIRQAEKGLGSLRIVAPHDGIFTLERDWRGQTLSVGQPAWPGMKIGEIPELSELEAKVYVLEADAGGLEVGRKARVFIEGRPGEGYAVTVSRVDAVAKTRESRSPIKYFETILTLEKTDTAVMKPGQKVRARIVLENVDGVLAVPRGALFERDEKHVVYRLEAGGRFAPVEVTIGRNSVSRVVIEKGLQSGDRIALRDPTKAAAGTAGRETESGDAAGGSGS